MLGVSQNRVEVHGAIEFPAAEDPAHDTNSLLAAEGIPYELETFTQLGTLRDDPAAEETAAYCCRRRSKNL